MSEFDDNTFRQLFEDPDRAHPADIQTATFLADNLLVSAPYETLRESSYETHSGNGLVDVAHAELGDNGNVAYRSIVEIYASDGEKPQQLFHIQHDPDDILVNYHYTGEYPTDTTYAMAHAIVDDLLTRTPWAGAPMEVSLFQALKNFLHRRNPSVALPVKGDGAGIFESIRHIAHTEGVTPVKFTKTSASLPQGEHVEVLSCDYLFGDDNPLPDDFDATSFHRLKLDISYPDGETLRFLQYYDGSTTLGPVVDSLDDDQASLAAELIHESGMNFPTQQNLQRVTDALIEFSLQEGL